MCALLVVLEQVHRKVAVHVYEHGHALSDPRPMSSTPANLIDPRDRDQCGQSYHPRRGDVKAAQRCGGGYGCGCGCGGPTVQTTAPWRSTVLVSSCPAALRARTTKYRAPARGTLGVKNVVAPGDVIHDGLE